jgi:DNA-binding MarR family transcriptional regulator
MDIFKIRFFRGMLRALEREIGFQGGSESQCCGVTLAQCHVLMELSQRTEAAIKDLSDLFGLDKSSLSRTVDKMVEAGYVSRTENSDDRRFVSIRLTEKGTGFAEAINGICDAYYTRLFERIPVEKHSSVLESIELLSTAMAGLRKDGALTGCCK